MAIYTLTISTNSLGSIASLAQSLDGSNIDVATEAQSEGGPPPMPNSLALIEAGDRSETANPPPLPIGNASSTANVDSAAENPPPLP